MFPWENAQKHPQFFNWLKALETHYGFSLETPFNDLPEYVKHAYLHGSGGESIALANPLDRRKKKQELPFPGLLSLIRKKHAESTSVIERRNLEINFSEKPCPRCSLDDRSSDIDLVFVDDCVSENDLQRARKKYESLQSKGRKYSYRQYVNRLVSMADDPGTSAEILAEIAPISDQLGETQSFSDRIRQLFSDLRQGGVYAVDIDGGGWAPGDQGWEIALESLDRDLRDGLWKQRDCGACWTDTGWYRNEFGSAFVEAMVYFDTFDTRLEKKPQRESAAEEVAKRVVEEATRLGLGAQWNGKTNSAIRISVSPTKGQGGHADIDENDVLRQAMSDTRVKATIAANPATPSPVLEQFSTSEIDEVRAAVGSNPATPGEVLEVLGADVRQEVRFAVFRNPGTPRSVLRILEPEKEYFDLLS